MNSDEKSNKKSDKSLDKKSHKRSVMKSVNWNGPQIGHLSLSILRFWGKGGKMEAKKGQAFLSLLPLPPPPSKISSPLAR